MNTKFQSQPRCQAPGDEEKRKTVEDFIAEFQSQPRCQAPGDQVEAIRFKHLDLSFNLNRDARPLATGKSNQETWTNKRFNLNRDARPLATPGPVAQPDTTNQFQSQPRCQFHEQRSRAMFQSQPRCQAPGDRCQASPQRKNKCQFQSQPRCQAPGDLSERKRIVRRYGSFNLNRDARPLATEYPQSMNISSSFRFNLNRDARPLATKAKEKDNENRRNVSISTEMPGPWRRR